MPPGYQPSGGASPLHGGVPWESPHGSFFGKWWETFKAVNFNGRPFFAAAAQNNNALAAATYNSMSGAIFGFAFGLFYFLLAVVFGGLALFGGLSGRVPGLGAAMAGAGIGIGILYWVLLTGMYAFSGFVSPWVWGGIHHLLLMLFKAIGPGKEYQHTVRVFGYGIGSAMPWFLVPIPCLNGLAVLVFSIINLVTGYDETHQCGVGKVLLALLSPVVCCCSCYFMMFLFGFATSLSRF
jgi:hypothetical protein